MQVEIKMKKTISVYISLLLLLGLFWGCDSPTDEAQQNKAILSGQVINSETSDPISDAVIVVLEFPQVSAFSDGNGGFSLEIEVEEATEVQLRGFKANYLSDTLSVLAVPGRTISSLAMSLKPTSSVPQPSGQAASIILYGVNPQTIGVRESGSPEVSEIAFQVQDSSGIPVDLQHSVQVNFLLGSSPGGEEFISPLSVTTSANGLAKTSLFSGTVSGVVQVIGEVRVGVHTIRSQPVAVAIHGGLPDSTHFSLAVEKLNFAGYNIYGRLNRMTAYVGDMYGNPVKPQTAVYFTTSGGLIEGSGFTNELGQATVNLISAAPKPNHPVYGPGFATITARTADIRQMQIETFGIVLFSGIPQISVNPTSIDVPNRGSQLFFYTVSDQNGNPLEGGTNITVSVETGKVEAVGNTQMIVPDTQSPSWTTFAFSLVDTDTTLTVYPVSVKIRTTGPNGGLETSISGISR